MEASTIATHKPQTLKTPKHLNYNIFTEKIFSTFAKKHEFDHYRHKYNNFKLYQSPPSFASIPYPCFFDSDNH